MSDLYVIFFSEVSDKKIISLRAIFHNILLGVYFIKYEKISLRFGYLTLCQISDTTFDEKNMEESENERFCKKVYRLVSRS